MIAMSYDHRRPPPPPREPPILGGRVPPHDLGAEAAVIAACIDDPARLNVGIAELKDGPDAFYSDNHRLMWEALLDLHGRSEPVDVIALAHWLRERELIQRVGGAKYIGELVGEAPAVVDLGSTARIVSKLRQRRKLIALSQRIAAEGYGEVGEDWLGVSVAEIAELGAQAPTAGWDTLDADGIFAELEPVPYVVEALDMAPGPPSMMAGYGYSKKTLSAQALGMAVAGGRKLWGRWPVRQGKVVHVDYEQGARLTRERYQRLARGLDLGVEDLRGMLEVVALPGTYLDSPTAEAVFTSRLEGATLAIIDSLRAAAPSSDENDSSARKVLDMLARVSERTGCCCLVIHHARKPQVGNSGGVKMTIRGSGALFDACQSIIVLGAEDGNQPSEVTHEKARISGKLQPQFCLRAQDLSGTTPETMGNNRWALTITAEDADDIAEDRGRKELQELADHVVGIIRKRPGMNTRTICKLARRRYGDVTAALQILEADGAIVNTGRKSAEWRAHAENYVGGGTG